MDGRVASKWKKGLRHKLEKSPFSSPPREGGRKGGIYGSDDLQQHSDRQTTDADDLLCSKFLFWQQRISRTRIKGPPPSQSRVVKRL